MQLHKASTRVSCCFIDFRWWRPSESRQMSDGPSASNSASMVMTNDILKNDSVTPTETKRRLRQGKKVGFFLHKMKAEKKDVEKERYRIKLEKCVIEDDDSDSGVSVDFRPGIMLERPISFPQKIDLLCETPVQREIRRGLEREKSLRQSRGLGGWEERSLELVEICLKRSLEVRRRSSVTNSCFDAEKRLAERKMLRDIKIEAKREQVLIKLGTVPGFYSRGCTWHLDEKKMFFEAFQQKKNTENFSSFMTRDGEGLGFHDDKSPLSKRSRNLELFQLKKNQTSLYTNEFDHLPDIHRGSPSCKKFQNETLNAAVLCLVNKFKRKCSSANLMPVPSSIDKESPAVKIQNPFFPLRPVMSQRPDIEQEITETLEREQELIRLRRKLYGEQRS